MFFLAQLMGIFSTAAAILCVQAKRSGGVLLGQFLANTFSGLSYALLGSYAGAWVCLLAAVQSVLVSVINRLAGLRRSRWITWISVLFAAAFVAGTAVTYTAWPDLISGICALLFVLTIAQEEAGKMRSVMLVSMSLWIIFDISVGAYTNIITHASTILSILTAKARLDRKGET